MSQVRVGHTMDGVDRPCQPSLCSYAAIRGGPLLLPHHLLPHPPVSNMGFPTTFGFALVHGGSQECSQSFLVFVNFLVFTPASACPTCILYAVRCRNSSVCIPSQRLGTLMSKDMQAMFLLLMIGSLMIYPHYEGL